MEVRRSARLAAKRAAVAENLFEPKPKLERRNGKILHTEEDVPPMIMLKQHMDNHSPFVNFVVHGLMKYEITDPKAEGVKDKTQLFVQITFFFIAIKVILYHYGLL